MREQALVSSRAARVLSLPNEVGEVSAPAPTEGSGISDPSVADDGDTSSTLRVREEDMKALSLRTVVSHGAKSP